MTLEYSSRRREVMKWYWRTWTNPQRGFVVQRLAIFLAATIVALVIGADFRVVPLAGVAALAALALYPLVMFKPQKRVLVTSPEGIATTIGAMTGAVGWAEINRVFQSDDNIVIQRTNGNAFVVPRRAFSSELLRQQFLAEVVAWVAAAKATGR